MWGKTCRDSHGNRFQIGHFHTLLCTRKWTSQSSQQSDNKYNQNTCFQKSKKLAQDFGPILWVRRTSPKEETGSKPFHLTFGHDVVLPIEICLQSFRVQHHNDIQLERYWELMFDELAYLDEERLVAMEVLIRQKERMAKVYNRKVKTKTFALDDYVWKVILPMDRRDRTLGKWSSKWEGAFQVI